MILRGRYLLIRPVVLLWLLFGFAAGAPCLAGASPRVSNTTLRLPTRVPVEGYALVEAFPGLTFEHPVAMAAPPGETNRLFVVERRGKIYAITNLAKPTKTLCVDLSGQVYAQSVEAGLLGLAFHPGFGR